MTFDGGGISLRPTPLNPPIQHLNKKKGGHCFLCSDIFFAGEESTGTDSRRIFWERGEWSTSFEERGYYHGHPDELNEMYFLLPWIWENVYRAS